MTLKSLFSINGRSLKFFRLPNLKNFSHSNHCKCSFENLGQISDLYSGIFRAEFRASPESNFRVTCKKNSGIRRAVGRAVATFFGMEVSMPVPGWHHLVQIFGVNADHRPSLTIAMPMFPVLLPGLEADVSSRSAAAWPNSKVVLADARTHVKGCKAKCVERANESKY